MMDEDYKRADLLLEEWVRQRSSGRGYPGPTDLGGSPSDFRGGSGMLETRNTKTRRKIHRGRDGELHEVQMYPAYGTETVTPRTVMPGSMIRGYARIQAIMERIRDNSKNGRKYWEVLFLSYRYQTMKIVAKELKCSERTAFQLKSAAMDQVVLLLRDEKK